MAGHKILTVSLAINSFLSGNSYKTAFKKCRLSQNLFHQHKFAQTNIIWNYKIRDLFASACSTLPVWFTGVSRELPVFSFPFCADGLFFNGWIEEIQYHD